MIKQTKLQRFFASKIFLLLGLTAVVLVIVAIFKPKAFNAANATQVLNNLSYAGFFLIGVSCLLISGGFDFSLDAQATVGIIVFAKIIGLVRIDSATYILVFVMLGAIIAGMAAGAIGGLINAFFVNKLNLMAFIATIGMSSVWSGLASWYTRGSPITVNSKIFSSLTTVKIPGTPIPWAFVFMFAVLMIYSQMLKRTRFGRSMLMSGGNQSAARLAGLKPKRITTLLFINASVLAVIGGLVWCSQYGSASPTGLILAGPNMTGLTSSILGGVAFSGGSGGLGGAFSGLVLIQLLAYALQVLGLPTWLISFVNGSLLVVALTIDNIATRRRLKKMGVKLSGGGMVMPGM